MAKRGTLSHRKTGRLARILDEADYAALGLMESFWHWVEANAPTGRLPYEWEEDFAHYVRHKDPERLRDAFRKAGLVDIEPAGFGDDLVHDWQDHCNDSVHMALARARLFFADGTRPKLGRLPKLERETAEKFYANTDKSAQETHEINNSEPAVHTPCAQETHAVHTDSRSLAKPSLVIDSPKKTGARENRNPVAEPFTPPTLDEVLAYCPMVPIEPDEGRKFWHHYDGLGWKAGESQIVNWRSFLGKWKSNSGKFDKSPPGRASPRHKLTVIEEAAALGHSKLQGGVI